MKVRRVDEHERETMRGLTSGTISVGRRKARRPCVVIGDSLPSWMLYVEALGVEVKLVLLRSAEFSGILDRLCQHSVQMWTGSNWGACLETCPKFTGEDAICLVDGRITSEILTVLSALGISDVMSTRRARRKFQGWNSVSLVVHHTEVGGVTEGAVHVTRHSTKTLPSSPGLVPVTCSRDASTVLSHSTFGHRFRSKPEEVYLDPPRCANLGTTTNPYYHGNGWLPSNLDRKTQVLIPVLNPPKPGVWGLRSLSGAEVLLCRDVPEAHVDALAAFHGHATLLGGILPGKCLIAGFTALIDGGGDQNNASTVAMKAPCTKRTVDVEWEKDGRRVERPPKAMRGVSFASETVKDKISSKSSGTGRADDDASGATASTCVSTSSTTSDPDEGASSMLQADLDQIAREERNKKATKSDDAEVPEYLWLEHMYADDSRDFSPRLWTKAKHVKIEAAAWIFRKFMLSWWKVSLRRSFVAWLGQQYPSFASIRKETPPASAEVVCIPGIPEVDSSGTPRRDLKGKIVWKRKIQYVWSTSYTEPNLKYRRWWASCVEICEKDWGPGVDAIFRASKSTWWNWDDGSRPFHWRWPMEYQERIRDGIQVFFSQPMKPYVVPQKDEADPEVKERMKEKLRKVRDRRYIAPWLVKALTAFFAVKKGDDDIRMVYDGSVSGLNESIWMPRFALPTLQTHLRAVEAGTYMCDLDIGEMFLNFVLHPTVRSLTGVDLTHYVDGLSGKENWEAWQRAAMGLTSSPYQACQGMGFLEEVIRGNPDEPNNIFRWDVLRMNLPGSRDYSATKPWVSKVRSQDGAIAVDFCTFVDDVRPSGPTSAEAWRGARRVASILGHLGIQDAPRKRRDSSQQPGAWTGAVLRTDDGSVRVLVPEEKWNKTKEMLEELGLLLEKAPNALPRKRLEQIRGYLVHVAQTYPMFSSYLIGLHMTIDFWRPNRDQDGWRFTTTYIQKLKDDGDWPDDYDAMDAPPTVACAPRLAKDLEALRELTGGAFPLLRRVRAKFTGRVLYGFGDASKAAFGATIQLGGHILYEYGQWSVEVVEHSSSNWRELANLVKTLRRLILKHDLSDFEIFMFTDNTTAEAAFWKGTSKSETLFGLVLELKKLELEHNILIHVIHVSGKRMIAEGTDGLSRADHSRGVMVGEDMLDFVPLHLDPLEREPKLFPWLEAVTGGLSPTFLSPKGWYTEGHGHGTYVWTVPPAAGDVVVEQLGRARLKRPENPLPPVLQTKKNYWRDFEGLCCGTTCRTYLKGGVGVFCANFFSKRGPFAPCNSGWCGPCFTPLGVKPFFVRKQVDEEGQLLDEEVEDDRFMVGRNGDHLMTPFQCELCHFRNIYSRDPLGTPADLEVMELFRRASLDAFGCRAASTVAGNLRQGLRGQRFVDRMGVPSLIPEMGPFPLSDSTGMLAACAVLDRSLDPGLTEEFVQWDTFRGMRTFVTNGTQAGVSGLFDSVGAYETNKMWMSKVPTHSFWFSRFMGGLHRRVGENKKQDEIVTIDVIKAIESLLERQWYKARSSKAQRRVAEMGVWFIAGFVGGLRGEEMLLLEYAGTKESLQYLTDRECPHVILVVSGRTKGNQLSGAKFGVPIAATTRGSNLRPGRWVKRLIDTMHAGGVTKGRLFHRNLVPSRLYEFEHDFFKVLKEVQRTTNLIDADMDVEAEYGILRSLRRGMTAHARNLETPPDHLKAMNRWASEMNSKSGAPRLDMPDVYATLKAIKPLFLRITRSF